MNVDTIEYSVIFILAALIVWMLFNKKNKSSTLDDKLEWINTGHPSGKYGKFNPAERLKHVISQFGMPDIIDKSKGGVAIWKKKTLEGRGFCWDRVELHDEQIPHDDPAPHTDFLYYWYKLHVPKDLQEDVRKLSDSITYDPLKHMLRVRCHGDGPNLATAVLAKRIATKEMTFKEAKESYGPLIFSTQKGSNMYNKDAKDVLQEELCDFQK